MKQLAYITALLFILLSCNSEKAPDCFQAVGDAVTEEFVVAHFSKIRIETDVALQLKQGDTQRVVIKTGKNLLPDVSVSVENNTLVIRNNNTCNLVREYGNVQALVTTPNITEIRNASSRDVQGVGRLVFPKLTLTSNSTGSIEGVRKSGDFYLNLQCENFTVSANGQSVFYVSGTTENATLVFSDEFPRFEGENFVIDTLKIRQRSANKMIVNPKAEISGVIQGTGDVISVNRPPKVDVEELFTGRLIFQD
ncbi:head GIN domain-containing protein [Marixanthomonas spongiae]|uniref:DUF2807 domain-containing protein n=1 Tax=Marixanthomonas spongiae TaxID=2174845 RepID=A0A2U0I7N0_9FLAO|nr:head GIN domain-containing protein [Marixanthomonas spongiae]PVW17106.1 DUF2807 domain-containing protein [Marixanthomonas spongiae]